MKKYLFALCIVGWATLGMFVVPEPALAQAREEDVPKMSDYPLLDGPIAGTKSRKAEEATKRDAEKRESENFYSGVLIGVLLGIGLVCAAKKQSRPRPFRPWTK